MLYLRSLVAPSLIGSVLGVLLGLLLDRILHISTKPKNKGGLKK